MIFYHAFQTPRYFAFLGRIRPEKGVHIAIEFAKKHNIPLRIAGRVKGVDREYFEQKIEPHMTSGLVEFVGELNAREKNIFMGQALAVIHPTQIEEPFGLVVTEAMACGTPVIASNCGAMKEIISHGKNGLVIEDFSNDNYTLEDITNLDRKAARSTVERYFDHHSMVNGYLQIFEREMNAKMKPIFPKYRPQI